MLCTKPNHVQYFIYYLWFSRQAETKHEYYKSASSHRWGLINTAAKSLVLLQGRFIHPCCFYFLLVWSLDLYAVRIPSPTCLSYVIDNHWNDTECSTIMSDNTCWVWLTPQLISCTKEQDMPINKSKSPNLLGASVFFIQNCWIHVLIIKNSRSTILLLELSQCTEDKMVKCLL